MRRLCLTILIALTSASGSHAQYAKPTLIAHRGASGYAPAHTLEAYRLAIAQHADHVLICMHDTTLERTTNVEEMYPGRKPWNVSDFTIAEIKRLDAGSWFAAKFKGATVPIWQEAIDVVRGKSDLYPETKEPEFYQERGFDMERLVMEMLRKNSLGEPGADARTPVIIQSFSPQSLQRLRSQYSSRLPPTLLISDMKSDFLSEAGLRRTKAFASGIGPAKEIVDSDAGLVKRSHALGLSITLYTFRSSDTGRFKSVREEMDHFISLGVDALFTDNPDQFPKS